MTRGQLERAVLTSASTEGRASQYRRLYRLEDYLHAGCGALSAAQAARRLGVSPRTVCRKAIPPAYTEHIGRQLLDHLREAP